MNKFNICFKNSKHISIFINFVTGVINIQGASSKEWIESDFHLVSEIISMHSIDSGFKSSTKWQETFVEPGIENINKTEYTLDKDGELEKLWEECGAIKNSIKNLQTEVINVKNRNDEILHVMMKQKEEYRSELLSMESVFDAKLAVFISAASKECEQRYSASINSVNNDVTARM